jgi:hypothetical protein
MVDSGWPIAHGGRDPERRFGHPLDGLNYMRNYMQAIYDKVTSTPEVFPQFRAPAASTRPRQ